MPPVYVSILLDASLIITYVLTEYNKWLMKINNVIVTYCFGILAFLFAYLVLKP